MHQIRYFLAVSRTLNFTRAAEECHVAQPSLTRAVKLLEGELGAELLRRERNLTHLTDFGQHMLPLLRQCYESALAAKQLAVSMKGGSVGSLALALSHTISMTLLVQPLAELTRAFAGLELHLLRGDAAQSVDHLKRGDAALAIAGPLQATWERLEAWPLFTEGFQVVVSAHHPLVTQSRIAIDDLGRHSLLNRPYCEMASPLADLAQDGCARRGRGHVISTEHDLVNLIAAEFGISMLPRSTPIPSELRRLEVEGLDLRRTVSVYAAAGRERSAPANALVKLLRVRDWSAQAV